MNHSFRFKNTLLAVLCMASWCCFSQQPDFKTIDQLMVTGKNFEAIKLLRTINQKKLNKAQNARRYFLLGKAYGNENLNDSCLFFFEKSQILYESLQDVKNAMETKLEIAYSLSIEKSTIETSKKYYEEYLKYTYDSKDPKLLTKGLFEMANSIMYIDSVAGRQYYFKALKQNRKAPDEKMYAKIASGLAMLYNEKIIQRDSAIYYYNQAITISKKHKLMDDLCFNMIYLSNVYYYLGDHKKAIQLLKEADTIPIITYVKNMKSRIHLFLALNYAKQKDYKSAYNEYRTSEELLDEANFIRQSEIISDMDMRYKTKEKELENLNLKVKNRNNILLIYLVVSLLFIGTIVGYLRIKFLSKKKQIAEQEKLIETQKIENLLKEQELLEIDKMLEGQEKERIKIANDLHDNLGSLMATLKLNFQNLKRNNAKLDEADAQLYDKTDAMIDEAYQKIRGLAHTKNAGVMAHEGLLPAITNIAKKASIPGKLRIEVVPFGLDDRLDSTMEVSIFRMVQEILTNAIKHAQATEITIHLTRHHDSLNIIIEDNGKGFLPNENKNEGMGLPNIEKKVEHMGGSFTIDSTKDKGTSVIIDIPL
ncbi:ATP-binding protein [Flavobacterium sp. XGLA_31]|uniref:ATP-binding protein n=1 Tax=Flavobacterium sp. XGLA_31 TaxID=3447666 RepID=UPI003F2BCADA